MTAQRKSTQQEAFRSRVIIFIYELPDNCIIVIEYVVQYFIYPFKYPLPIAQKSDQQTVVVHTLRQFVGLYKIWTSVRHERTGDISPIRS